GVQFECTSTKDTAPKTLAIKQAPYSDEAEIEDMGSDPRRISIQAVFTGPDYLTWVNALEAALSATGPGELIHPVFGVQ
ncbi:multidrug DMT transporter, partial [Acinetobacter baumannii]